MSYTEYILYPLSREEQRSGLLRKYTTQICEPDSKQKKDLLHHELWPAPLLPKCHLQALIEMYTEIYSDEELRERYAVAKFREYRNPSVFADMLTGKGIFTPYEYISLAFLAEETDRPYNNLATFTGLWPHYDEVEIAYLTSIHEMGNGYAVRNTATALHGAQGVLNTAFAVGSIDSNNEASFRAFNKVAKLMSGTELTFNPDSDLYKFEINPTFPVKELTEDDLY
jgi:hypothetical protein